MRNVLNLKFILIIISVFFFINIDVYAATEEELSKYEVSLSKESNVCVYSTTKLLDIEGNKLPDPFKYVVIVFNKKNEVSGNKYGIQDYTLISGNYTYKTNLKIIKGEVVTGEVIGDILDSTNSNKCDDFFVQIHLNMATVTPEYNIYLTDKYSSRPGNHYEYDVDKTNKFSIDNETELKSCVVQEEDGVRHEIVSYDPANGFFGTTNNKNLCPAKVTNGYIFETISIDINKFQCSNWKIAKNRDFYSGFNKYPSCEYFLVDKDADIVAGEGAQLEQEGNYVTKYVGYRNDAAPSVSIIKDDDGSLKAILKEGKKESKIEISNINNYRTIFLSNAENAKENYPKYLNYYENKTYKLSSTKEKDAKTSYIVITELTSFSGFSSDLTIKECEDLVGGSLVKFLKNNVIKIIYIGIPILLIILTSFDFAKVVFIDDKEGIQGAAKKFGKRAIIAILIYLIPTILIFLTNIFASNEVKMCVEAFKSEVETSN